MIRSYISQTTIIQFLQYAVIGLTTNMLGYCIFLLLSSLGIGPKLAATCLYILCASISFVSNWHVTFKKVGTFNTVVLRFMTTYLIGYLINLSLLVIFVDHLGFSQYSIEALAIIIVAMFVFVSFKFFVFTSKGIVNEEVSCL